MTNELIPIAKFLRLSTGEDIIAGIVDVGTDYLLQNPMKVVYIPVRQEGSRGYLTVSLMQWILPRVCGEGGLLQISKTHVLITAEVNPDMMKSYSEAVLAFEKINEENEDLEINRMGTFEMDDLDNATQEEIDLANKMLGDTLKKKPGPTVN